MTKSDATTGPEEKMRRIFYAIGLAITQWQQVEHALTQLFVLLINAKGGAASAAFASVLNFNSKLGMVDSAAYVVLHQTPLFAEWGALNNALGRKAKKRNEIAHFMLYQTGGVFPAGVEPDIETLQRDIDWHLMPTAFDGAFRHRHRDKPPSLTANDIMNRATAFLAMSKRVWDFGEKVRALQGPPPGSPASAPEAPPSSQ
jgi:hypothetical protein